MLFKILRFFNNMNQLEKTESIGKIYIGWK